MNKMIVSSSPHVTSSNSTRKIMMDVMIALVPALTAATLFFGIKALIIALICIVVSVLSEFVYNIIVQRGLNIEKLNTNSAFDGSSAVTGLLIALNVPSTIPLWIPPIGCVFAVIIVKMLFGGIGKNIVNPAMIARIFLFLSFGRFMASVATQNLLGLDAVSGATWLSADRTAGAVKDDWIYMLVGNTGSAAMGETSAIAILIGFVYLLIRKVIDFRLPLIIIGGSAVFALLLDGLPNHSGIDIIYIVLGHILSGGLLLGAVFMATDYATSPNTNLGNLIYGLGIAFFVIVMRVYTGMPEGMSFAIVLMNFVVPLLDKYILPRPYAIDPKKKEEEKAAAAVRANAQKTAPVFERKDTNTEMDKETEVKAEAVVVKKTEAVEELKTEQSTEKAVDEAEEKTLNESEEPAAEADKTVKSSEQESANPKVDENDAIKTVDQTEDDSTGGKT